MSNINNEKKEIPTGITLNDKDYLNSLLCNLKEFEKNMTTVLTEASNEKLYKDYKIIFDEVSKLHREAFELMFNFGWYTLETANKTKISSTYKTLSKELNDLKKSN